MCRATMPSWPGPVDAGPLRIARYTEPVALLVARLAYEGEGGPELAYRFERSRDRHDAGPQDTLGPMQGGNSNS
jgi:hypothetical protein